MCPRCGTGRIALCMSSDSHAIAKPAQRAEDADRIAQLETAVRELADTARGLVKCLSDPEVLTPIPGVIRASFTNRIEFWALTAPTAG